MIDISEKEATANVTRHLPLALFLIAAVTVAVYWPVLSNDFISYDDTDYVTMNMAVRQGVTLKGFIWAFSSFHAGNWHPLTWLSHMLDVELFGLNPLGHHATNLLLHTLNAVLLCALLHRLTGFLGRSLVVALLFALHPLHVESVAWIAERKDVLSTLFGLLTMGAYGWYAARPSLQRYLAVAALFILGLMAKQMLVTLPILFLLMDYWPLNRLGRVTESKGEKGVKLLLVEKVPFLLISALASVITLRAQESAGAVAHGNGQALLLSIGNALLSYVIYIRKMFWPAELAIFYPFDPEAVSPLKVAGALLLLATATGVTILLGKKRPYLIFGWCWYLVTLLPVIGFIRIGGQAMADRYTYVPLIGLFIILVWGVGETTGRWRRALPAAAGTTVITLAILSALTIVQIRYWQNSYDLYDHALAVVEGNWLAHNNLGILLSQKNRTDEALVHFRESVRLNPKGGEGLRNLGNVYQMLGKNSEAIQAFRQAIDINPKDLEGHLRLGYAYLFSGNKELAYEEYRHLQQLDESYARPLLDSIRMTGGE